LDSNIHFTKVHALADKQFTVYPIGNMLNRYDNILIPEEGRTVWHLIEACQATAFHPLASHSVVSGTLEKMRQRFPGENFPSNQANPDVGQSYRKASFAFKSNVGIDYKNIMSKTQMSGKNQVLIGTYERYCDVMNMYEATLFASHPRINLQSFLNELRILAKNNDWHGQIVKLADNMHRFPEASFPPLFTTEKVPKVFNPDTSLRLSSSLKRLRAYSKAAYAANIPEDNFTDSHVQQLMEAAPY
jgi:hypothetical protein